MTSSSLVDRARGWDSKIEEKARIFSQKYQAKHRSLNPDYLQGLAIGGITGFVVCAATTFIILVGVL